MERSAPRLGRALVANGSLLGAIAIWGSFFPLLAYLLETWDPYSNAAGRALLGSGVLGLFALARHGRRVFAQPLPWRRIVPLALFGVVAFNLLMTLGVAHAGPISAAIVAATGPVSAAVLARVLYRQPIRPAVAVAAVMAVAGGACVALAHGGDMADLRGGELLVFGASVAWLWYSMRFNDWLGGLPTFYVTAATYAVGAAILTVAVLVLGAFGITEPMIDTSAESLGLMALVALTSTAVAVLLWLHGVGRLGVAVGAAYGNLVPVVTVAGAALFGITPRPLEVIGGLIVIAGVVVAQSGGKWDGAAS
ncbi:MAG: DMT family transporter [Alphaproteobacteria bacterium]